MTGKVELPESVKMVMPADNVTAVFELITPVVVKPGMYMGKFVINVYLISMV